MCCERVTITWSASALRRDPAAVVADERDRDQLALRASASASMMFAELPLVESATATSPARP